MVCPPTDIGYRERFLPPYASERRVAVYGEDREERLRELPREVAGFENALSTVISQILSNALIRR